jgi:hypothetical protein
LERVADITVSVDAPIEIGDTGPGLRRIIPITGGRVDGPLLRGRVLAGGADYQLVRTEGVTLLDARYALELDDGTRVFVHNTALRRASPEVTQRLVEGLPVDPADVYFRCAPTFETPAGPWRWLAQSLHVGVGARYPDRVELAVFRLV